jgi:hypothetical protein
MNFSAVVQRVIELATAIRNYWDTELPKRHPKYPLVRAGEDSGPPPPEEAELREFLKTRPPEEIYKLLSLMYLGRGDFDAIGITEMARDLVKTFPAPDQAIRHIMAKGPLADYLADGVRELAAHHLDIDHLEEAKA